MDIGRIPLFSLVSQRLAFLGERQEVLGLNVANADTPGYQARDVDEGSFQDFLRSTVAPVSLAVTDRAHMTVATARPPAVGSSSSNGAREVEQPGAPEPGADGNNVDLEEQVIRITENAAEYQMVSTIYRKQADLIRTALGRAG